MNYGAIKKHDTSDGIGIRVALYVSGCHFNCTGCHNRVAQDFNYGKEFTQETINEILEALSKHYIKGLSILGGEPLAPENRWEVLNLIRQVRAKFPDKDIWLWSGYVYEDLLSEIKCSYEENSSCLREILDSIDILIDGPFILSKRDISDNNKWKGSTNQRIIKLK